MSSVLTIGKLTKSLAGVLASIATVVVIGAPLTLAEYYAHTGSAGHTDASPMASRALAVLPRKS